ncbi:hypothetical protein GDO78_021483 [Eleutherodactylus coqui]|uniref:Uncharacterized protein n=1 Tax=Eleutherodactylus coqui TaxID=57060 RepID=A0A8J6EC95_ELECQ|nr:hypothetical protein GDO78_021483 [Eleutherodactylus coqui]
MSPEVKHPRKQLGDLPGIAWATRSGVRYQQNRTLKDVSIINMLLALLLVASHIWAHSSSERVFPRSLSHRVVYGSCVRRRNVLDLSRSLI